MSTTHLLARAVLRDDDHVLVVRADGQSHTFLPGGHREAGEGLTECLRRELHEELGVQARIGAYLGGVEHQWRRNGEQQYEVNHCFSVAVPDLAAPTPPPSEEDYLSFDWVPVDRLAAVELQPAPVRPMLAEDTATGRPSWGTTLTERAGGSSAA